MGLRAVSFEGCLVAFLIFACPCAPTGAQDVPTLGTAGDLIERVVEGLFDGAAAEAEVDQVELGEMHGSVTPPEDAALRRRVAQATRLAENGRVEDAAQALGRLAESLGDEDVFLRLDGGTLRGGKVEIRRLIGESSAEVRAAYELAFGPAARRMLDESPHEPTTVRRIAGLYPHTRAGAEALYRLAEIDGDAGAFAEAAGSLERLLAVHPGSAASFEPGLSLRLAAYRSRCGDRTGAEAAIGDLLRRFPAIRMTLGGDASIPVVETPVGTLLTRIGSRGAASSSAFTPHPGLADAPLPATEEPFLVPRWSFRRPTSELDLESGRRLAATVPVLFPTVAGELVLVPERDGFVAHDLATGSRLWDYARPRASASAADGIWTAPALWRLSTDGRSVFLIEPDDATGPPRQAFVAAQNPFPVGNSDTAPAAGAVANFLTALDVRPPRQGNRLWRVGGSAGADEPKLAGYAFLGPPLAAHGRLYAVAERGRTVRLVVLDADSGRLDWSLDIGRWEVPLDADLERRRIGATPTLTRGTLLCPTAGGCLVAVELAGRSLAWGFRYPRASHPTAETGESEAVTDGRRPGWLDGMVLVGGGRALVAPPEAEEIFCLDVRTGRLLWRRPRGEHRFVAAADAERVLLVGRSGTTLLNAAAGSTVAATPFPEGTAPTGRGYAAGPAYMQPLSDGSLCRIELASGVAAATVRSSRGIVLGNLVWHDGTLLSLGPDDLRAYDGRRTLESAISSALATNPDKPAALLRRADLHAEAGRYAEAIADCRRAFGLDPSPAARNHLIAALLDGVRNRLPDTAAYDAELEALARPK